MSLAMLTEEQEKALLKECDFKTSRSGGKGGQNVNKVETKAEIEFDVAASFALTDSQKNTILKKHKDLVDGSWIKISASSSRSQLDNKQEAKDKLIALLNRLLRPVKKRIATKPGKKAKEKKLKNKKFQAEKKESRRKFSDF